jgi:hypothetical protein
MKTIEEIQEIFKVFIESNEHSKQYLQGSDWHVTVYKPFEDNDIINYPFRIYGKISGSYFGGDYRWYGGVTYTYNIKENSLTRTENENELHPIIVKHVDLQEIQMTI